jgi:hypothetical protein
MKGIGGGLFFVLFVGWAIYVMATPDSCTRVSRISSPVRIGFDGVRWLGQNWLSTESRLELLLWSINADTWTQEVVAQTLYGSQNQCGGRK